MEEDDVVHLIVTLTARAIKEQLAGEGAFTIEDAVSGVPTLKIVGEGGPISWNVQIHPDHEDDLRRFGVGSFVVGRPVRLEPYFTQYISR